eukprot:1557281-Pleurochrysis_carterae.AAC.3
MHAFRARCATYARPLRFLTAKSPEDPSLPGPLSRLPLRVRSLSPMHATTCHLIFFLAPSQFCFPYCSLPLTP